MRMSKLFASTILATVVGTGAALADPVSFTWNPSGAGISTAGPFTASNITVADFAKIDISNPGVVVEDAILRVQSFNATWSDDVKAEGTSRVTWEIEQVADSCRLTVTHDQLREGANDELYGGWPMILSGLKTLLETGEDLTTPGSLRYAGATSDWAS